MFSDNFLTDEKFDILQFHSKQWFDDVSNTAINNPFLNAGLSQKQKECINESLSDLLKKIQQDIFSTFFGHGVTRLKSENSHYITYKIPLRDLSQIEYLLKLHSINLLENSFLYKKYKLAVGWQAQDFLMDLQLRIIASKK